MTNDVHHYKVLMYIKTMHNMALSTCLVGKSKPVRTTCSSTQFLLVVPKIAWNSYGKHTYTIGGKYCHIME